MTLYQVAILLGAITPDHGRVRMSPGDHARYFGATNRQVKRHMRA